MGYVETDLPNGGVITEWVSPPPSPTHKTKGIQKSDWRALFTDDENELFEDAYNNIAGDLSFLPNSAILDTDAKAIFGSPTDVGKTYRKVLIRTMGEWRDATTINADDPRVLFSTRCLEAVGIIGAGRADVILQGIPL